MGKTLKCKDIGMTDCSWEGRAETEEELIKLAEEHAPEHGLTEIPPEMMEQLKAAIKDE